MSGIRISPFLGMLPKAASRLLADGAAVDATNVNLSSGEIRPIKQPLLVNTPEVAGPWLSVYRAEHDGAQIWMAWARDVDVTRPPMVASAEPRFYWSGDCEPRYAPFSRLPDQFYALGIPRPVTKPAVAAAGGSGVDVTRVYAYTFYSALNEESAESPASTLVTGKPDGSWTISNMDAAPANSGTGVATFSGGVTTFVNAGLHWLRAGDEILIGGERVAVSEVPSGATYKVPGDFSAQTTWERVAPWNTAGMKRRLYRSAGSSGSWQLVHDDVGTTYVDMLSDTQIMGDELISSSWAPPPSNLKGLLALPDGSLCGFFGNQLCRSEPYQPHAWPIEYRRATGFEIVGIGAFGTSVVVCTAGAPYIASGSDIATVTLDSVDKVWPCKSKRGVVSIGDGVLYPTTYGMAYIGLGNPSIWTESFFTRQEWAPLDPTSMVAAAVDGRVYVRWIGQNGSKGIMVFSPAEPTNAMTVLGAVPDELYADPRNGQLYLVDEKGIHLFDAGVGARLAFSWRSKEYHLPTPLNLGAAKIDFVGEMSEEDYAEVLSAYQAALDANHALVAAYAGAGGINGSSINGMAINGCGLSSVEPPDIAGLTFTLYIEGKAIFTKNLVADDTAFRLPAGYKTDSFSIGLTGAVQVKSVKVATTMQALKGL